MVVVVVYVLRKNLCIIFSVAYVCVCMYVLWLVCVLVLVCCMMCVGGYVLGGGVVGDGVWGWGQLLVTASVAASAYFTTKGFVKSLPLWWSTLGFVSILRKICYVLHGGGMGGCVNVT